MRSNGCWCRTSNRKRRPALEQILCLWLGSQPTPGGDRRFHFRLVGTGPSLTKTPPEDLNFQKETGNTPTSPPERPTISIVRCSLPACGLCWSFGDIVFMNDSKLDPLKYVPCITGSATWFYIPNLWLHHRLHRQHGCRESRKVKEKHFCFYISWFHTPSAPSSLGGWERRTRLALVAIAFRPGGSRLAKVIISVSSILSERLKENTLCHYSVHGVLLIFLQNISK